MSHHVRFDILGACPDPNTWLEAKRSGTEMCFSKGDYLIRAGELVDGLFFIERGQVRMDYCHVDGLEKTLWYIGENSFAGETPYFSGLSGRTSIVCTVPAVTCFFPRQVFDGVILKRYPELIQNLLTGLAAKIRLLSEHIFTVSFDPVAVRLCKYLALYTHRLASGELVATLHLRKHDIANLFGIHRVTLYKAFKDLELQGVFDLRSKSKIYIINEKKFFAYVSGSAIE